MINLGTCSPFFYTEVNTIIDVLLTVLLSKFISVINQLDAQNFCSSELATSFQTMRASGQNRYEICDEYHFQLTRDSLSCMHQQIDTCSVITSVHNGRFLMCTAVRMTLYQTRAIGNATDTTIKNNCRIT